MTDEDLPILGTHIKLQTEGEAEYHVLSMTSFGRIEGRKVIGPSLPMPYALCTVEIFSNQHDRQPLPQAVLPVAHREDFKVLEWLRTQGTINQEDVTVRVRDAGFLARKFMPLFRVTVRERGDFAAVVAAASATDSAPFVAFFANRPQALFVHEPGPFKWPE